MIDLEETSNSSYNNKLDTSQGEDTIEKPRPSGHKCVILIPKFKKYEEDKYLNENEEIKDDYVGTKKEKENDEDDEEEKKTPPKKGKKNGDSKKGKKKNEKKEEDDKDKDKGKAGGAGDGDSSDSSSSSKSKSKSKSDSSSSSSSSEKKKKAKKKKKKKKNSDGESEISEDPKSYTSARIVKMIKSGEMEKLTVKKLKAIAREKGISTRGMAKRDILAKLKSKLTVRWYGPIKDK